MSTIVVEGLTLKRKKKILIKDFSYNFLANKIYAIVGKSDSGIDYLSDCLTSIIKPTSGNIYFDGINKSFKTSKKICFLKGFKMGYSVDKIMKAMKAKYPNWDNYFCFELLNKCNINFKQTYENLSIRDKQIVCTVCTIASNADVKVLAYPVEGTDLKVRNDIYQALYKHHRSNPSTYIITTNNIDEIENFTDELLLFDKGLLIESMSMDKAKRSFFELTGKKDVLKSLISGMKIIGYEETDHELTVCLSQKLTKDLVRKFQKYQIKINDVNIQKLLVYLLIVREKKELFN